MFVLQPGAALVSTVLILRPRVFLFSVFYSRFFTAYSSFYFFNNLYFISTWVLDLAMGLGDVFCSGLQFLIFVKLCNSAGQERKDDGKPCVTSMTIILFEKTFCQTSHIFPLNRSFCRRAKNINVK